MSIFQRQPKVVQNSLGGDSIFYKSGTSTASARTEIIKAEPQEGVPKRVVKNNLRVDDPDTISTYTEDDSMSDPINHNPATVVPMRSAKGGIFQTDNPYGQITPADNQ